MSIRSCLAVVGLAIGIGAAGCSSGGSNGGTTGGTTGGNTVTISNMEFSPSQLVVAAGATITFKNNDITTHTAWSEALADDFTNGAADGGWTFSVDIDAGTMATITVPSGLASGTVQPYFCAIHTSMMTPANPTIKIQ